MRILLINPPISSATVMPYSIACMKSFLGSTIDEEVSVLDLNAEYHFRKFRELYESKDEFFGRLEEFLSMSKKDMPSVSKKTILGKKLDFEDELFDEIIKRDPDFAAMSLVYNSQVFYAARIIKKLEKRGVKTIIGGPADLSKLSKKAIVLKNYHEFSEFLIRKGAKKHEKKNILDFSDFEKKNYFTKDIIYPLRSAYSCPYQQCTFCTHHQGPYSRISISELRQAVEKNKMKKISFIDDGFTPQSLEELSEMLESFDVSWWCQLRPVKEFASLLDKVNSSGLNSIAWGVESGSQKVLDLMQKCTNVRDVEDVLRKAKNAGIINMVYIMFGFPGETEKDFYETIEFLKRNSSSIDLVSVSVFGLQKGSWVYMDPERFGVEIFKEKRTFLGEKLRYEVKKGLSHKRATELKKKHMHEIRKINKIPEVINACKEQVLNLD
ncbi:radical SAM protein [Candidatus Woesearchaeota archaeon]|nr:radical SAM protein [Candidatus Woesearchaeota archaeon]